MRGFTKAERSSLEAALNPQVLIVSLGAKLRIEKCKEIRNWFLLNEFSDFGNTIQTVKKQHEISEEFVKSTEARSDVVEYISTFDKSIIGFDVQEIPKKDDNEEQYYKVTAFHKPVDGSENVGIPLEEESAGTLKMFSLYPDLLSVIQNGGLYCVDELNARLHPLLVRNILLCFINPAINIHHAQLIFTTHDTWMLRTDILRRDEIWFTEKNEQGMTELYSLAEFVEGNNQNLSYGEKLERNYFLGKYGAIPSVERIDLLKEDRDGEE